jgi:proline racemase
MDTPAGIVRTEAKVKDGKVTEVSFLGTPSFLYKKDIETDIPGHGKVKYDISFGSGSFFALVNAKEFGLKVEPQNARKISELAMKLRGIINDTMEMKHPELSHIKTVDLVEVYDEATHSDANYKNVVIFGQGQVDRSPCGTGTSAKLAALHAKGELKQNEKFVYESILGTLFKGEVVEQLKLGEHNAVIPRVTGSAYITGFNHFVIDPTDPVKYGFILG